MKQISKNLSPAKAGEIQSSEETHSRFTDEWVDRKLGEISLMGSGGTPNSKENKYYGGDIKWVSIADMTGAGKYISDTKVKLTQSGLENSSARIYSAPVILYAMYASLGEVSIATNNVSSSQAILGISVDKSVSLEYIYYLLLSYKPIVKNLGQQGTQSNLNKGMVQEFHFRIPSSKSEQQAIVRVLSDIDSYISAQNRLISKKRLMKQGVMQQLLTGKIRLQGYEEKWERQTLGTLLKYEQPTAYIVKSTEYQSHGDVPVLTAGKSFILGFTKESTGIFSSEGVIIFDDFTTATQYVDFDFKVKSSAMKILHPIKGTSDIKFMHGLLKLIKYVPGDHKRHWISEYVPKEVLVPRYEEQQAIGEVLSAMDVEIDALVARRDKTLQIKTGMMQDLLTGKVRL